MNLISSAHWVAFILAVVPSLFVTLNVLKPLKAAPLKPNVAVDVLPPALTPIKPLKFKVELYAPALIFPFWVLTVENTGSIDYANNLTVIDSLPEGLVYANEYKVDGAKLVKFVADGQKLYWTITNISVNSSAVITVKILADKAGDLVNNGTLVPPYGNNITVNCTITPVPRADLEIVKLVSQKVSHYNDRVIWTLIVKFKRRL